MGVWTEYDVLIHNPAILFEDTECKHIENFEKLFDWQTHVRVALESGEITDIGNYDSYGRVEVGDKIYEITEYSDINEGLMITDYTYQCIKNHKLYKGENIYQMLLEYKKYGKNINRGPPSNYVGNQDVIVSREQDYNGYVRIGIEDWAFIDPTLPEGNRNKERINNIVNDLMEFCVKTEFGELKPKPKIVTEHYECDDRFWEIVYDAKNGGEINIVYGKKITKEEPLDKIKKLIESKVKAGYTKT